MSQRLLKTAASMLFCSCKGTPLLYLGSFLYPYFRCVRSHGCSQVDSEDTIRSFNFASVWTECDRWQHSTRLHSFLQLTSESPPYGFQCHVLNHGLNT